MLKIYFAGLVLIVLSHPYMGVALAQDSNLGVDTQAPVTRSFEEAQKRSLRIKSTQRYQETIRDMYRAGKADIYQMQTLRALYPFIAAYKPFSDKILEEMMALSFMAQSQDDPVAAKEALEKYKTIVSTHFANLEVLFLASSLAEQDVRFGDPIFLKQASEACYKNLIESNDGLSVRTAIKVVTFGEEDTIIRRYAQGRLVKSDLIEREGQFLNVHQFENTKTKKPSLLYFDISTPIQQSAEETSLKKRIQKF